MRWEESRPEPGAAHADDEQGRHDTDGLVRSISVVEIVGVIGLVLPPLTGVAPVLALVAAIGFAVLQVLATGVHLSRGETKDIGLTSS